LSGPPNLDPFFLNTPTKTLHLIEIKAAQKNTEFRKVLGSQFYRYSKWLCRSWSI